MSTPKNSMSISLTGNEKLNTAESLFVRDHVTEAYPLFQELAKEGNPRALYFLGEYHRWGFAGLPVDEKLGFQYHHEGAEKGEVLCQLNLAYEEETIQEDVVQAVIPKVFPLAQAGDVAAQDELGDALTNLDHLTDASLSHLDVAKEAEHWFQKAAEAGYWRGVNDLAYAYWGETNIGKDLYKAIYWYDVLAQMQGDHVSDAVESLGLLYEELGDYDKKFQQSAKWAAEGYGWPMYYVAECYENGKGVTENQDKAIEWYQKAYECHGEVAGHAAFRLGCIYDEQGNWETAFAWDRRGAEEGLDWCMRSLANRYRNGGGVSKDLKKAMEWYEKAYNLHGMIAGDAAYQLAGIYSDEENDEKKWEWTKKSANEGYDEAMIDIGLCYDGDDASSEDQAKAMEWYQTAYAQHGTAVGDAALLIAMMYDRQEQAEKAFEWYSKGAEEGSEDAMYFLAQSYEYGAGVQANREKAIEWYQKVVDCHGDEEEEAEEHLQALLKEIEEG